MLMLICMQDTFARATHSAGRPSAARNDRVSCIQNVNVIGCGKSMSDKIRKFNFNSLMLNN